MVVTEPFNAKELLLNIIENQNDTIEALVRLLRYKPEEETQVGTITTTNIPPSITIQDPHVTPYYLTDKDLHTVTC